MTNSSRNLMAAHGRWATIVVLTFGAYLRTAASLLAAITATGNVSPVPTATTTGSVYVGNTANATLQADSGSKVGSGFMYVGYDPGVTGSVLATDAGTLFDTFVIYLGYKGTGDFKVLNGAVVDSASVYLGYYGTAAGTVTVDGAGSKWTNSFVTVGDEGTGSLTISNGGVMTSITLTVGSFDGTGVGLVTGPGSSLSTSSTLYVGQSGGGTLTIENGAKLASNSATIGSDTVQSGTLVVSGAQSSWTNNGDLSVGNSSATGKLSILQGAVVTSGGDTAVARNAGSVGYIEFDNGTLNTGGLTSKFSDLRGTGTINTHGLVTDTNLVFDATHPLQQQFILNSSADQNVTLNLDASAAGSSGAGLSAAGTLTIADGRQLLSKNGTLGQFVGSNGTATVSGANSLWKMSGNLSVGSSGSATLNIQDGAVVEVAGSTTLGITSSTSRINFNNGTLNTGVLLAGFNQLNGVGTINTHGIVTDGSLIFDSTHSFQQQIVANSLPGQNVVINLDFNGTTPTGAGGSGQGSLTIADGKVLTSTTGYLGYRGGSVGTAFVTGGGSQWGMVGRLNVGYGGIGNLTVSGGANVSDYDGWIGNGTATVTGAGSTWTNTSILSVNSTYSSNAELKILAGGKVTSDSTSANNPSSNYSGVGLYYYSTGSITVDGAGSNWTNNGLIYIGADGDAALNITGGGTVVSSGGTIAGGFNYFTPGTSAVTVSGAGSSWSNSGFVTVGERRNASLTISNGGSVTGTYASVAGYNSTTCNVTVSGQGSNLTLAGQLYLGGNQTFSGGTGTLNIQPGGLVQTGSEITLYSSRGYINLSGGTLTTTAIKSFTFANQFNWTGGTLHVGTFNGSLTNSAGVLAPGQTIGKTTITGSYTQQAGGTLQIELANFPASLYDNLTVNSLTSLAGTLQLTLVSGFIPSPASTFTVLQSFGALSGAFGNVTNGQRLATTDGLGTFLVNYGTASPINPRQVVLSAFNLTGDFNADGKIDGSDYVVWRRSMNSTVPRFTSADADGSGTIDNADYNLWRARFGTTTSGGSGAGSLDSLAVPEPKSIAALAVALLLAAPGRVRKPRL